MKTFRKFLTSRLAKFSNDTSLSPTTLLHKSQHKSHYYNRNNLISQINNRNDLISIINKLPDMKLLDYLYARYDYDWFTIPQIILDLNIPKTVFGCTYNSPYVHIEIRIYNLRNHFKIEKRLIEGYNKRYEYRVIVPLQKKSIPKMGGIVFNTGQEIFLAEVDNFTTLDLINEQL